VLPLLTQLRLGRTVPAGDAIEPSAELLRHRLADASALDHFPPAIALAVFEQLLRLPDFSGPLQQALSFASLLDGSIAVAWHEVPRNEQQNPGWIWLQQLQLMSHTAGGVLLDPALRPFVLEAPPTKRRMSQAELEERLRCRQERANLAEEYVLAAEQERLRTSGAEGLADEVVRVSIEDVLAGFDIRSFETSGAIRHIEVKSSAGPREFFVLSRNEYETAREKGDSYWLAWVEGASRLPAGPCAIAWFRNPVTILAEQAGLWELSDGDLVVRRVNDDSPLWADPAESSR
jgi:hypothetical protein